MGNTTGDEKAANRRDSVLCVPCAEAGIETQADTCAARRTPSGYRLVPQCENCKRTTRKEILAGIRTLQEARTVIACDGNILRQLSGRPLTGPLTECGVCGRMTNAWTIGGWPGCGPRLNCPHGRGRQREQHEELGALQENARKPGHPRSYRKELRADIAELRERVLR